MSGKAGSTWTIQTRDAYHELERAGLVTNSRPFVGNQLYSLTRDGYNLKLEMLGKHTA